MEGTAVNYWNTRGDKGLIPKGNGIPLHREVLPIKTLFSKNLNVLIKTAHVTPFLPGTSCLQETRVSFLSAEWYQIAPGMSRGY